MHSDPIKDKISYPMLMVFLLVSLLVITGGFLFYQSQERKITYEKQNELEAIINMKVEEINRWRMEHLRDGEFLSKNNIFEEQVSNFFINDGSEIFRRKLLNWMENYIQSYDYQSIHLLDESGNLRLSWPQDHSFSIDSSLASLIRNSESDNPHFYDLHFTDQKQILLDMIVPLFPDDGGKIGTIILRINPEAILFQLIQSWPTRSESSETLLLRRDGDSVLYLNELKHHKNTALELRLPLSNKNLPATVAVTGFEGVFEGNDYRKIPVISYLRKIPESPWFMVAKVDKKEIYSPLYEQIALISIIVTLIILISAITAVLLWRNQRMMFFQELNSVKDKFFTIISHDLKTPFSTISGFAELLREKLRNNELEKAGEFAAIIFRSSQKAVDLLNNLSEWSRLQTRNREFFPVKLDLVNTVKEIIELLGPSAQQKSIILELNVPDQCIITADRGMISSVIRNLISNSIKFTNPGGRVLVSITSNKSEVLVEINDTGVGIKPEMLNGLFRIGNNISTPGTQNEEGTGLGLILCKEFIDRHGGKINVESEPLKGSRFSFTIPSENFSFH